MKLKTKKLQGGTEYKRFLDCKTLTRKEAMLAYCYQCMGGYEEGKQDCLGKSRCTNTTHIGCWQGLKASLGLEFSI